MNTPSKEPVKLLNRNFVLLWQGQFISQFGSSVSGIALSLWVVNVTNSATILGMLMMVAMIPGLVLQPLGGSIADRFQRKRIIVLCDLVYGILALLLGTLLFLLSSNQTASLIAVFVLHVLMSTTAAFFGPAVMAFTPSLVPKAKIASANALTMSSAQVAGMIGRAVGGILYRVLGAPILFLLDGLTFIISAVSEQFIQSPQVDLPLAGKKDSAGGLVASTKEGVAYVWQWKGLRVLILVAAALNFFVTPVFTLLPFYVKDPRFLAAGDEWFGFLMASLALGTFIGFSVGAILFRKFKVFGKLIAWLLPVVGIFFFLLATTRTSWLACLVMLGIGLLCGIMNSCIISGMQTIVPSEKLGRTLGIVGTVSGSAVPLAMGLSGVILDHIDKRIDLIFYCGAVCFIITALLASLNKEFRNLSVDSSESSIPVEP